MRIPSFVPMIENERRSRELAGFIIEVLVWGYIALVGARIIWWDILLPFVEGFAIDDVPRAWATSIVTALDYDSRYSEFSWSAAGIVFAVGALIGAGVGLSGRGFGPWVASLSKLQVNNPEDSIRIKNHWSMARREGWVVLILTILTGWVLTRIQLGKMVELVGLQSFGRLVLQLSCGLPIIGKPLFWGLEAVLNGLVSVSNGLSSVLSSGSEPLPRFALECVPSDASYYGNAVSKLLESVYLAFMATFFAVPVAFVLAFFGARNLTRHSFAMRLSYTLVRLYINITRSIEPIIWAILFSVWIGIGPFAGALALMVHSISSLVKQYSEAIEGVDEGPIEALEATGASHVAVAWFAVVPQVVMPYLAFTIYRWDINVRMATIIGLVGGGGIGGLLIQEQGLAHWTQVGTLAALIFIVVWTMDFLSAKVREAIQ
ncbi:MAG: phosphonate ABC transporter, permease protein PhnE [Silvanigrellaceae bacterium]